MGASVTMRNKVAGQGTDDKNEREEGRENELFKEWMKHVADGACILPRAAAVFEWPMLQRLQQDMILVSPAL